MTDEMRKQNVFSVKTPLDWLLENGGDSSRWTSRCKPMVKEFSRLIQQDYGSDKALNRRIQERIDKIKFDSEPEDADPICDLCVEWVRKNPEPIQNG